MTAPAAHLAQVVASFARAIAAGEMTVVPAIADVFASADRNTVIALSELQDLASLCDDRHLPNEAARIRRWVNWPGGSGGNS